MKIRKSLAELSETSVGILDGGVKGLGIVIKEITTPLDEYSKEQDVKRAEREKNRDNINESIRVDEREVIKDEHLDAYIEIKKSIDRRRTKLSSLGFDEDKVTEMLKSSTDDLAKLAEML